MNLRSEVLSGIRNVLGEKLSVNLVGSEQLSSHNVITVVHGLHVVQSRVQRHNVIGKSSVGLLTLLVKNQVDQIKPGHQCRWQFDVVYD